MVGIEWDMINLIRDIYCRLVLGQALLPGGQGPGMQQPKDAQNPGLFEQAKTAERPLQGGGIVVAPSPVPKNLLASLPGISHQDVEKLSENMTTKLAAKEQVRLLSKWIHYLVTTVDDGALIYRRTCCATCFVWQPTTPSIWTVVVETTAYLTER